MADHNITTLDIALTLPRASFTLDVDLHLPGSGITVLFGASGSGKTSVLRCVAGLEHPSSATIIINGETWQDDNHRINIPTWRRPLGYVFQEASLFNHLNVKDNLEYGIKRRPAKNAHKVLSDAIDLLGIGHLLARRPEGLSGGERQRVAIARALATQPRLLLLDEPLASLDPSRREEVMPWLEKLHDEFNVPMLYVTHAVHELQRLADHVVVLQQGRVKAHGPIHEVLTAMDPPLLTGEDTGMVLTGRVAQFDTQWGMAEIVVGTTIFQIPHTSLRENQTVRLLVLARDISIATLKPENTSIQNLIPCHIETVLPDAHPAQVLVKLTHNETTLVARITRRAHDALGLTPGQAVWAQVKSVALVR
ncbi:MAG: molybdenum ABC transporter ATP-binding protein [Pusillimonas sp.]